MKVNVMVEKEVDLQWLQVDAGVRYWEDAEVNGVEDDEDGNLIPFKVDDAWKPLIQLETGVIANWPEGTVADIHYKVCDAGIYSLLDEKAQEVIKIDGYVPEIMCPEGEGYGDYIIMKVDEKGQIANWKVKLNEFMKED